VSNLVWGSIKTSLAFPPLCPCERFGGEVDGNKIALIYLKPVGVQATIIQDSKKKMTGSPRRHPKTHSRRMVFILRRQSTYAKKSHELCPRRGKAALILGLVERAGEREIKIKKT